MSMIFLPLCHEEGKLKTSLEPDVPVGAPDHCVGADGCKEEKGADTIKAVVTLIFIGRGEKIHMMCIQLDMDTSA